MEYIILHQNYIYGILVAVVIYLSGRHQSISTGIGKIYDAIVSIVTFLAGSLQDPDANGKVSLPRLIGLVAAVRIMDYCIETTKDAPPMMWNMFMVTIGYAIIAKLLSSLSPAILDIARGWFNKMSFGGAMPQSAAPAAASQAAVPPQNQ